MGTYSFTGAPVFVTVAATGIYDINAFGASGGTSGGKGAEEGGNITLTAGEQLEIIVGGQGIASNYGGSGGGGTFVLAKTGASGAFLPILVAGGGGGSFRLPGGGGTVDAPGNGMGGASAVYGGAGGGSGVMSNGGTPSRGGNGGTNRSGGYAGGAAYRLPGPPGSPGPTRGSSGGFGGGGASASGFARGNTTTGGGGGGYTGGVGGYIGASPSSGGAGGGTSFDSGTAIAAQTMAGVQIGNGMLNITPTPCYCPGTLILTNRGEVPVEVLAIGDVVVTASGEHRPVKWLGRRSYAGRFLAANPGVQPIRFHAGSLGGGLPRRDLLVSPEHAMVLDGVLVPARCLVNGSTIVQEGRRPRVDYYHVELDSHDVLLAEGAPSESYVDDDSRAMFHNASEFAARYPATGQPAAFCLPRVEAGFELAAIQQRLANLADPVRQAA